MAAKEKPCWWDGEGKIVKSSPLATSPSSPYKIDFFPSRSIIGISDQVYRIIDRAKAPFEKETRTRNSIRSDFSSSRSEHRTDWSRLVSLPPRTVALISRVIGWICGIGYVGQDIGGYRGGKGERKAGEKVSNRLVNAVCH